MLTVNEISQVIRDTLDQRGIELTYFDTNAVAEAVLEYLEYFGIGE